MLKARFNISAGAIILVAFIFLSNLFNRSDKPPLSSKLPAGISAQATSTFPLTVYLPIVQKDATNTIPSCTVSYPPIENGTNLTEFSRSDGKKEIYYVAGDPFLEYALPALDDYWSNLSYDLLRGDVDDMLPLELKGMQHKPAIAMMRRFADYVYSQRDPNTGLIPYSYGGWDEIAQIDREGRQSIRMMARLAEFMAWFPDDPEVAQATLDMAQATREYFDYEISPELKGGIVDWVAVTNPQDYGSRLLTMEIGSMTRGISLVSNITGNISLMDWADQKLEFVWQERINPPLPLLAERFRPWGWDQEADGGETSDTDSLYYVRELFEIYYQTNKLQYRDWALATTEWWYEHAWLDEYGHFSRKLKRSDGQPAIVSLYGDAKYNTLFVLIHAYRVTQDVKYLNRLKEAWNNLLHIGRNGFVAETIVAGVMEEQDGLDTAQSIFLVVLLDAYEASGDPQFLMMAEAFGQHLLENGRPLIRENSGQGPAAYLRLALARQNIWRLDVTLNICNATLIIKRANEIILQENVPGDIAVIYLPEDEYEVLVYNDTGSQTWLVTLDGNKSLSYGYPGVQDVIQIK